MENVKTKSGLCFEAFNKQVEGKQTSICVLSNKKGTEAVITNYGAKIVSLMVPDNKGEWVDVVLGHASIDDYLTSGEPTFGATCGRYAKDVSNWMEPCTISYLLIMVRIVCMEVCEAFISGFGIWNS